MEPRAPVAKAALLRSEQMAEHEKREAPRRSVAARFVPALKCPIARLPTIGALPSTVIGRPPSSGLLPACLGPHVRRRIFRAPKFRNPPLNPIAGRALACFALQEANDSRSHPPMSVW
jgi:hypothetical protein